MSVTNTAAYRQAQNQYLRAMYEQEQLKYNNKLNYKDFGYAETDADTVKDDVYTSLVGVEKAVETAEKQKYAESELIEGFKVSPYLKKYTQSIGITEEMIRFDLTKNKKIEKNVRNVAKAATEIINEKAAQIFENAFNTTFAIGGDGKSLIAIDHPNEDGNGSQSNLADDSTHKKLGIDSYAEAYRKMIRFKDGRGRQISEAPTRLVVGPENTPTAMRIFNSTQLPNSANNDINPYQSYGRLKVVENKNIDSDGSALDIGTGKWFLINDDLASEFLMISWGWSPEMKPQTEVSNGTEYYYVSTMFAPFFADWRFVLGSKGDASSV